MPHKPENTRCGGCTGFASDAYNGAFSGEGSLVFRFDPLPSPSQPVLDLALADANALARTVLGWGDGPLPSVELRDLFPGLKMDDAFQRLLAGAAAAGGGQEQIRWDDEDGTERWLRQQVLAIGDSVVVVLEDISRERDRHAALEEDARQLDLTVAGAMDAIVVTDETQRIIAFNPAAETMFGFSVAEILGERIDRLIPERFGRQHRSQIEMFARTGVTGRSMGVLGVLYGLRRDGSEFPIEVAISQIAAKRGPKFMAIVRDTSERVRAYEQSTRLAEIVNSSTDAIISKTIEGEILSWNPAAMILFGYTADEAIGRNIAMIIPDALADEEPAIIQRMLRGERVNAYETRRRRKDGTEVTVSLSVSPLFDQQGQVVAASKIIRDITEQIESEARVQALKRVSAMLSAINALIVHATDFDHLCQEGCRIAVEVGEFSKSWLGLIDARAGDLEIKHSFGAGRDYFDVVEQTFADRFKVGSYLYDCIVVRQSPHVFNDVANGEDVVCARDHLLAHGVNAVVWLPLIANGRTVAVLVLHASKAGVFDAAEMTILLQLAGDLGFAYEHIEQNQRVRYLSYYDALTGLSNRKLFSERFNERVEEAKPGSENLALALIDIERFRGINDAHGLTAGDAILIELGRRLTRAVGSPDRVGRVGPDRFVVVLDNAAPHHDLVSRLAGLYRDCIDPAFQTHGYVTKIAAKLGVAMHPADGPDFDGLFRNAEAALARAKTTTERTVFYDGRMTAHANRLLNLESALRQGLDRDEFLLHYQAKTDIESGRIVGMEALLRWNRPDFGLVSPAQFVPLLESSGLIVEVGLWVARQAALDQRAWASAGLPSRRVAVNVSPRQLQRSDFIETFTAAIDDGQGLPGIDIEITEASVIDDFEDVVVKLETLRTRGVQIAIDDFGTGYSSLAYLARLPVYALKIDRAFIADIDEKAESLSLVSTMISLAHSLKLLVIAEGVERTDQRRMLRLLRCDQMQGYLHSRPMPFDEMSALLRSDASA